MSSSFNLSKVLGTLYAKEIDTYFINKKHDFKGGLHLKNTNIAYIENHLVFGFSPMIGTKVNNVWDGGNTIMELVLYNAFKMINLNCKNDLLTSARLPCVIHVLRLNVSSPRENTAFPRTRRSAPEPSQGPMLTSEMPGASHLP